MKFVFNGNDNINNSSELDSSRERFNVTFNPSMFYSHHMLC